MDTKTCFRSTFPHGLSEPEVQRSREEYGQNVLTPPQRISLWKLYLDKYRDPIIIILLIAAAISLFMALFTHELVETIGIFLAIFFATTVGFYFERDAIKKFSLLTTLGEEQLVKVRRGGKVTEIPRHDVVVGDVMLLETGDEIPADGILMDSRNLQVDESQLTGEQLTDKHVSSTTATASNDREGGAYPTNVVLRSTMVMAGRGEAVVTAVGDATEIGKVAQKATEVVRTKTPLNMQLERLATKISRIGAMVSISAFTIFLVHDILTNGAVWHSDNYMQMAQVVLNYFMMAVTLIVMAVPEGLPMAVTLSLALNMRRMLKSKNLVRQLHACETMGAVTVICTDKTGTLTQNCMTVKEIQVVPDTNTDLLVQNIAVNSTAYLDGEQTIGNPTEAALLRWLEAQGHDYLQLRQQVSVAQQQPFSTEEKYMMTLTTTDHLFVKGAPEVVLHMCTLSNEQRHDIEQQLTRYQQAGMRTLALATASAHTMRTKGLLLQAIFAIEDPIRTDVPPAVAACKKAGIEIKVVTGDTANTAIEIGRQIGIFQPSPLAANKVQELQGQEFMSRWHITGADFSALTDKEAYERAPEIKVMSRARPTDKQRLVEMLQKHGEIVAVTGDGTNDAPALHHAHIGLSLGSGTSVAKEASDITLLDDSFKSIANAVMWGRSLYKNIQRFLFFQLVVNLTALLLVLAGSVVGTEMPLTVTQILWVNLIMDTFAALALASLPPSREVMTEKPRHTSDFIITPPILRGILWCGLLFFFVMLGLLLYCERHGVGSIIDIHELTLFFTTFVMLQFWNLFNAKALGSYHSALRRLWADRGLLLVLVFILLGQWLIVTFGGRMFRTVPLSPTEWLTIIAATSVVLWGGEVVRLVHCRRKAVTL